MARKLTMKQLKDEGACHVQRVLFYNRFKLGTTVTKAKCIKYAEIFDWRFGRNFLTGKAYEWYIDQLEFLQRKWDAEKRCIDIRSQERRRYMTYDEAWEISRKEYEAAKLKFRRDAAPLFYKAYNGKF